MGAPQFYACCVDGAAWNLSNARVLLRQVFGRQRNIQRGFCDHDYLSAAATWLAGSLQTSSGSGIAESLHLSRGWSNPSTATTAAVVPTLLTLAGTCDGSQYAEAARLCVNFLLKKLGDADSASGRTTAQLIDALLRWNLVHPDPQLGNTIQNAAQRLVAQQDGIASQSANGDSPVPSENCGFARDLAYIGNHMRDDLILNMAVQHLNAILRDADAAGGWLGVGVPVNGAEGFHLHTIVAAVRDILHASRLLANERGIAFCRQVARALLRRLELSGSVAGLINRKWQNQSSFASMLGTAELALFWFELYEQDPDLRYVNVALKALDIVTRAQVMEGDPRLRGGVPEADPIWAGNAPMTLSVPATNFLVQALLAKTHMVDTFADRPRGQRPTPADLPLALRPSTPVARNGRARVVVYAEQYSVKLARLMEELGQDFKPDHVFVETAAKKSWGMRSRRRLRENGFSAVGQGLQQALSKPVPGDQYHPGALEFCRRNKVSYSCVHSINDPSVVEHVRQIGPDLAIHADAGILRAAIISVPRIGTLNGHPGVLPSYRGIRCTEWARLNGDPVGCTVHWIDPGIDTGDIICVRLINPDDCRSVSELRAKVFNALIAMFADVVRTVLATGQRPVGRPQRPNEGVQFYRLHPELLSMLERELVAAFSQPAGARPATHL